ncbi:uncharacterized protein LOC114792947 [Denticeps clupeoides]|uniref:uncharacterized protein LOC114792947 n=1 Tax=Denticeps clupeoides TaxID=299321 RepID=UPI0010A387DE|nr:uncharacterized protein LOC114792947 [Denticeps clupeoides]
MPSLRTLGVFKCWEWPQTWILCSLLCMCHVIAVSIHCKPGDTVVLRSQKNITVSEKDDVRWIFKSNRNNESLPRKGLSNGSLKIPPLRNEDISGIYELEIFYMTGQSKTKENFSLTVADNSERSLECKEETECLQSNICSCCIPPNQNRGYVITLVAVAAFVTLSLVTFFVMVARQRQKKPNAEKNVINRYRDIREPLHGNAWRSTEAEFSKEVPEPRFQLNL